MARARGTAEVTSWNEDTYEELDGGTKLVRATVEQKLAGDIEGNGAVQWLMSYRPDGTAYFVGLQRVTGSIGDRDGSFVLETVGEFDGKVAAGSWTVVDGSATKELVGLYGSGSFEAPMGKEPTYDIEYELS